jgi:iron(III) transport system permease protein
LARLTESGNLAWSASAFLISLVALLPIIALGLIALKSSGNTWPHLVANVLPDALRRTLGLMAGVGALSFLIGTDTAWLVTMYRFPGRRIFQWLLLLPLAVPTYIIAYAYLELLDYSGIVQSSLRELFGWQDARNYWFPDIRSLGGAIFVMSAVLYPYVYITARASFVAQSVCVLEVSRTLGRTASHTFWQVALPLARPALAAGVALGADGDPERYRRGRILRRKDPNRRGLRYLARPKQPCRCRADSLRHASVRFCPAADRAGAPGQAPLWSSTVGEGF